MASEVIGSVAALGGFGTEVHRRDDGLVTIFTTVPEQTYDAKGLAALRELLDRAAMPGQSAPGAPHDHSWAEDMDEVRACCPDHNPLLAGTGIRCPGDAGREGVTR